MLKDTALAQARSTSPFAGLNPTDYPVLAAAILIGQHIITARTHMEAIQAAKQAGLSVDQIDDLDAFITGDGEAIDRFQALMRVDSAGAEYMLEKGLIPKNQVPHIFTIEAFKTFFSARYRQAPAEATVPTPRADSLNDGPTP